MTTRWQNISKSFTHKISAKTSWHRYMERNYFTVALCVITNSRFASIVCTIMRTVCLLRYSEIKWNSAVSVLSASRQRPIVCLSIRRHCNAARVGSDRRASLIKCAASCRPFRRIDNDTAKAVARPRQPRQSGVRGTRKLGTSVEDSRQKRQRKKGDWKKGNWKTATEETANGKLGNWKNRQRKMKR